MDWQALKSMARGALADSTVSEVDISTTFDTPPEYMGEERTALSPTELAALDFLARSRLLDEGWIVQLGPDEGDWSAQPPPLQQWDNEPEIVCNEEITEIVREMLKRTSYDPGDEVAPACGVDGYICWDCEYPDRS